MSGSSQWPRTPPYRYSPIVARPPLVYPGGKRMAFYVGMNIEHFHAGVRSTSRAAVTAALPVDVLNHGWRDYGTRVGIWRLIDLFDRLELRQSALVNADAATAYPQIVAAGRERGWAWVAHGQTNSQLWTGMEPAVERVALREVVETIEAATGTRPRGWLGPALTETAHTPALLAELGLTYTLGWGVADDQPFALDVPGARLLAVPYSIEVNDIPVFLDQSTTAGGFEQMIVDQFDVLHAESQERPGAVFGLSLHPFLVGQPFRMPALERALRHVRAHDDVWFCTTDELAEWYLANAYDDAARTFAGGDDAR
ncbi:polysaccharide deacetylase family protein [Conexibacter sp. CPCC 206217]|uniref:polysaccharide deacetylase family protein n=1 Tax=Conexibacter sp. CPCC 206217 TaxID=3064574 RepID=UPI002719E405|nr:polysaccharide deacetylase family protein [Conexibacter sp. CPCC 206217]MDO8212065.1 polysaccharide deacetylase family protein [Conexibacter sp. CPCC 206217]